MRGVVGGEATDALEDRIRSIQSMPGSLRRLPGVAGEAIAGMPGGRYTTGQELVGRGQRLRTGEAISGRVGDIFGGDGRFSTGQELVGRGQRLMAGQGLRTSELYSGPLPESILRQLRSSLSRFYDSGGGDGSGGTDIPSPNPSPPRPKPIGRRAPRVPNRGDPRYRP